MEINNQAQQMLALLSLPAFFGAEGKVLSTNREAQQRMIREGMALDTLFLTGWQEYKEMTDGCLYVTLQICEQPCSCCIQRMETYDLFVLDQESRQAALQAYALAAKELRKPLSDLICLSEISKNDTAPGFYQLMRMVDNMADACRYTDAAAFHMESCNLTAVLAEVLEKSAALCGEAGYQLQYTGFDTDIYGLADRVGLQRAVYNLLSNAFKFSPAGSKIITKLTRSGNLLRLTVTDPGRGIRPEDQADLFGRYLRQPAMDGGPSGIGLGMLLTRCVASAHKGTVLVSSGTGGTSVTMTLTIQQDGRFSVRTPVLTVDSGWDRGLVELSDILPAKAFQ